MRVHLPALPVFAFVLFAGAAGAPPDSGRIYLYNKEFSRAAHWYGRFVDTTKALTIHRGYQDACTAVGGPLLDSCRERYRSMLSHHEADPFFLYLCGRSLDGNSGLPYFDRALATDPCNVLAINAKGACAFERGDAAVARDQFAHSISCNPSFYEAYNNLAQAYIRGRQFDRAKAVFRRLAARDRDYPFLYEWLGDLYLATDDAALAAKSYRKAVEKGQTGPAINFKAGYACFKQGDYGTAIDFYEKSLAEGNRRYEAYFNLGVAQELGGRPADAIETYQQAYALSHDYHLLYSLGNCAVVSGLYSRALTWYRQFLDHEPRSLDALFGMANAYQMKQDFDQAVSVYQKIITLDTMYAKAYYNLGSIYAYHVKNRAEMKRYWGKYIELFPRNDDVGYIRAELAKLEKSE